MFDLLNETELYKERLEATGEDMQLLMAIEECAELIEAICHYRRKRVLMDQIATEVADVLLMASQLRYMVGASLVDTEMEYKIKRLKERNRVR